MVGRRGAGDKESRRVTLAARSRSTLTRVSLCRGNRPGRGSSEPRARRTHKMNPNNGSHVVPGRSQSLTQRSRSPGAHCFPSNVVTLINYCEASLRLSFLLATPLDCVPRRASSLSQSLRPLILRPNDSLICLGAT